jgi:hypothetical protein
LTKSKNYQVSINSPAILKVCVSDKILI